MKERKIPLHIFIVVVVLSAILVVTGVVVTNLIIQHNITTHLGTQVENHIGYFDEDNPKDQVATQPKVNGKAKKDTSISTYKKFLKASKMRKKNAKSVSTTKKVENKNKTKLTSLQKAIQKKPELNNGEWLPPIKD